jgi:hypothetical protein
MNCLIFPDEFMNLWDEDAVEGNPNLFPSFNPRKKLIKLFFFANNILNE